MASIRFTEADRDDQGFVSVPPRNPEPRSLADLLPTPAPAPGQSNQRRPMSKAETAAMIGVGLLLAALMGYLYVSGDTRPAIPPRIPATIPAATQTRGDGVRKPSPTPAMLPAYGAPNESPRWQIEDTRAITPTAHYGDDWIQADVAGSGVIWLKAGDWPALAIVGPDLAPRPTATARPYVPQAPAATAPPPPPPCADVGVPGKMVRVCDYAELSDLEAQAKQQWLEQYGGNAGIVSTPSPQVWETTP